MHVRLTNGLNDGNTTNLHQCQVIKDPEKIQDPAGIRTQDLLITSQTLMHKVQIGWLGGLHFHLPKKVHAPDNVHYMYVYINCAGRTSHIVHCTVKNHTTYMYMNTVHTFKHTHLAV